MRKGRLKCLILFCIAVVLYGTVWADPRPAELFYYNPDSPQSNLSRLKRSMDNFLSRAEFPITFQPFAHLVDFESQLKGKPPAFVFVPQWYLKKYGVNLRLRPLLIPIRNGEPSYRKVLLGTKRADLNFDQTSHPTLAMTSMGPDGETILDAILFSARGVSAGKINAIIVPKDSDALFALALGQVDMALVVKENLDLIAKINPNILQSVCPLLESAAIPMPVLCFTEGVASTTDIQRLKELFLGSKARENLSIIMEMLQINEWQAVTN